MQNGIFKEGDLVQHRVSKEKGIVTNVSRHCITHKESFGCIAYNQCKYVDDGDYYEISSGFKDPIRVEGFLLEPVTQAGV